MLLAGKNILVFAATGAIGSGVAHKLAREGANVYLSGRNGDKTHALAKVIRDEGCVAQAAVVDATDPAAIEAYVQQIAAEAGRIDGVFNAIGGHPAALGYPEPVASLGFEQFMLPLQTILGSTYLTARAAGLVMAQQGGGSILTLSATLSSMTAPFMANISATCAAIEGLTRSLAGEFGRAGVRVNCVRSSGMPETPTIQATGAGYQQLGYNIPMNLPPLGRQITVQDTAGAAAFLLSDLASGMTGQVVTVCAGAFVD